MGNAQREVYEFIRETDQVRLEGGAKVRRLLRATMHPHSMVGFYAWPSRLRCHFDNLDLSTKLMWIKDRVTRELEEGAKVAIGTGIYVSGITRPQDDEDNHWIGAQLREWFGEENVLIIDGTTSQAAGRKGVSRREAVIRQWRSDPKARILLVSIRACPDAINLSVPSMPGVAKLFVTTLSFPWIPWKQFIGRYWRDGAGVPVNYKVPILRGTVDESLYRLVRDKWDLQQLFRAQIPLTKRELELFDRRRFVARLVPDCRNSVETVNFTSGKFREFDEDQANQFLGERRGLATNAERFAQAFVKTHDCSAAGHIARFMKTVIGELERNQLVQPTDVLDAGCGPLTLERVLEQPVYGVDMVEPILRLGRDLSPCRGVNSQVGFLTQLPREWKHKFSLSIASLVLDWTSVSKRTKDGRPIRVAVLQELVRVTDQTGWVWLTFTSRSLNQSLFDSWCSVFEQNQCRLIEGLTGVVEAVDHQENRFDFWSICFCPGGNLLGDIREGELMFAFEQDRIVVKRGRRRGRGKQPQFFDKPQTVQHEQFVVKGADGKEMSALEAAQSVIVGERGQ